MTGYRDIDDCYVDLAGAVVKDAVDDYYDAIFLCDDEKAKEVEKWFTSEWAQFLTMQHGDGVFGMAVRTIPKEWTARYARAIALGHSNSAGTLFTWLVSPYSDRFFGTDSDTEDDILTRKQQAVNEAIQEAEKIRNDASYRKHLNRKIQRRAK